jgi:ribosome-binding protein aMBF1 (putative translation factor)
MKNETELMGERFARELINMHRNYETRISRLENMVEDMADALTLKKAMERKEESLPSETVKRIIAGENPLRVWREHRCLSQTGLAEMSGVRQNMISGIESGSKKGSIKTLKALAEALNVDLEEIA